MLCICGRTRGLIATSSSVTAECARDVSLVVPPPPPPSLDRHAGPRISEVARTLRLNSVSRRRAKCMKCCFVLKKEKKRCFSFPNAFSHQMEASSLATEISWCFLSAGPTPTVCVFSSAIGRTLQFELVSSVFLLS